MTGNVKRGCVVIIFCLIVSLNVFASVAAQLDANTQALADAYGEMVASRNANNDAGVQQWSREIDRLYAENRRLRGQSPISSYRGENTPTPPRNALFSQSTNPLHTDSQKPNISVLQFTCVVIILTGMLVLVFA